MNERRLEILNIVSDLGDYDNDHLLLEPYELAAIRMVKVSGNLIYNMFFFDMEDDKNANGKVTIKYSSIKPHIVQLYIDSILIVQHVGANKFNKIVSGPKLIPKFGDKFGLELINLMQSTIGAITDGLHTENATLFGAAIKLLNSFIFSILDLYQVTEEIFYGDVEEYVFDELGRLGAAEIIKPSNKLKTQFKGKKLIILSAKIDRRRTSPFVGFKVTVENTTCIFEGATPYGAFLAASQYINEKTKFKDIKFLMDIKTKSFLNSYSIMFVKGPELIEKMTDGFYPVLVPKGTDDMEGFLNALT